MSPKFTFLDQLWMKMPTQLLPHLLPPTNPNMGRWWWFIWIKNWKSWPWTRKSGTRKPNGGFAMTWANFVYCHNYSFVIVAVAFMSVLFSARSLSSYPLCYLNAPWKLAQVAERCQGAGLGKAGKEERLWPSVWANNEMESLQEIDLVWLVRVWWDYSR